MLRKYFYDKNYKHFIEQFKQNLDSLNFFSGKSRFDLAQPFLSAPSLLAYHKFLTSYTKIFFLKFILLR